MTCFSTTLENLWDLSIDYRINNTLDVTGLQFVVFAFFRKMFRGINN